MSGILWPGALTSKRVVGTLSVLILLLILVMFTACLVGSQPIQFSRVLQPAGVDNPDRDIFLGFRLPRVLLGVVVGAALATSGAALQAILRNPLADPHIVGISGGAALGAIIALVWIPQSDIASITVIPGASFLGAIGAMLLIYRIASRRGMVNPYVLLLAGVIINSLCSALILLINSLVDLYQAHNILFWLIGSLSPQSYGLTLGMFLYCAVGLIIVYSQSRNLNLMSLGEESAHHLGANVNRSRFITFVASSLLVGGVVSFCGLIGFVGLVVPHILRLLFGPDHRLLLPSSTLVGAAFLVAADTIARTAVPHTEIPVGVVTSLCGGPFFVLLLMRSARRELAQ